MGDRNGMTNVMVSVPEDFVQHVAELPADDGVGGERRLMMNDQNVVAPPSLWVPMMMSEPSSRRNQ